MLTDTPIHDLERHFSGRVILPNSHEYDRARRVHNGAIIRRPALIAICANYSDVARALKFACDHDFPIAVRSGGHSQVGHSVCDGGIVIDLSGLKNIKIDSQRTIAWAEAGVLADELDEATQMEGLATTLGQCPSVGIGGLTTGGGFGWLTGRFGLTCDNLISARVLTADARELRAAADENQDLFWALRGGGGNFGIALEFEYQLHPVTRVIGGLLSYPISKLREGLTFMRDFLSRAPDDLTTSFGLRPLGQTSVFAVAICVSGDPIKAEHMLEPLRAFATPIKGALAPLSYLQMQSIMGESPSGSCLHTRGGFMRELSDAAIETIVEMASRNPSPSKSFWLDHYHGAMCRVAQDATAFAPREPGFGFLIQSEWDSPAGAFCQQKWVNESVEAMEPFSAGIAYVANLGDESRERVKACYGPNYARLTEIKRKYDPGNRFRLNQNIVPTPA